MKWKEFIYQQVIEHCNNTGSRTFTLQDFLKERLDIIKLFRPDYKDIEAKIRQQLQFLRKDDLISFTDNRGHYTLRGIDLLDEEAKETRSIDLAKETPEKKEYIIETYVRNVKWVKKAKETFGYHCLFHNCRNTFLREDGTPYIEVHHIIPLCHGGEDAIWNLSVLCAHHHSMAHFADIATRITVEKFLLNEVSHRI